MVKRSISARILQCFKREDYINQQQQRRSLDMQGMQGMQSKHQQDDYEKEQHAKMLTVARFNERTLSQDGRIELE